MAHERWLEARGLDLEVVTRYGLFTDRQSPGGRDLVIPYRRDGKIINRKYRGPQKRFRQDAGAPRSFAPVSKGRDLSPNSPVLAKAACDIARAKVAYRECLDRFGTGAMWIDCEPVREFTEAELASWLRFDEEVL